VNRAEYVQKVGKCVKQPSGIEVAEAKHSTVSATRVVWEDRLQGRMLLRGRAPLLTGVCGNSDHPDIAVAPGLLRNPLDQVIMIPLLVEKLALRLCGTA
jgi:hypothetical protein